MILLVGCFIVIGCVLGGYVALGGKLAVLWQPFELVIIGGACFGAFIIGSSSSVLKGTGAAFKKAFTGSRHNKKSYLELLTLLYQILKLAKTKGALALEAHIENPKESSLFAQFPNFMKDHHAVVFLCDYLRMVTLGVVNPHEVEALMDEELETHHQENEQMVGAIQAMADGMPALGIVAAVLGIIKTMGSITEPPEVLGHLIGGALVGTFLGVFLSYGYLAPIAQKSKASYEAESKYLLCIKAAILAHLNDCAPAVSVEFARKTLMSHDRPTFYEVEDAVSSLPAPA